MASTEEVMLEVLSERILQVAKGYTPEHDDAHGEMHILEQAMRRLPHVVDWIAGQPAYHVPSREDLVQAAACLIAAIEFIDRNES